MRGALNVDDLIVSRSDRSNVDGLSVTIHQFPDSAQFSLTPPQEAYIFWYRPRREKGKTWVTVPELGLDRHHISRSHLLVSPPSLTVYGESQEASGAVVKFSFSNRFFEAIAKAAGYSEIVPNLNRPRFFAIDQRTEALCRLLMEETEDQCPNGPLYFEPLARALALRVLSGVRDKNKRTAVPPGIRQAVQRLETDFAENQSLDQLASVAQMSRSHFSLMFRQFTGNSPHEYLLQVRLNQARKLIRKYQASLSLAEIAATTGFCDQAHLNRHFQRFFGMTPATFRSQQMVVEVKR